MTPQVGIPIVKADDRILCYACAQGEEWKPGDTWLPPDVENYPATCEVCGQVLIHASQAADTPPSS